jgi:hypothetical protein
MGEPTERLRPRGMDGDWTKRKRFCPLRQPELGEDAFAQAISGAGQCRNILLGSFEVC